MFKDNGRFKPAKKSELAGLKGKHMVCPNCGEYAILRNVNFADTKCGKCGTEMVDAGMSNASKTTG